MARKVTIGSIVKSKDGTGKYIKVRNGVTLKEGQYINVESKAELLAKLEQALSNGKISAETAEKQRGYIEKIPDFVLAEASVMQD